MEKIRSIVLIACFLSIAISVLDMLYPNKRFEKQVGFIFSLVFLIGITTPFITGGITLPSFSLPDNSYKDISADVNGQLKLATEKNIETALKSRLTAQSLAVKNISVDVTISGQDSISITKVQIVPEETTDCERVRAIVASELGEVGSIVVSEVVADE